MQPIITDNTFQNPIDLDFYLMSLELSDRQRWYLAVDNWLKDKLNACLKQRNSSLWIVCTEAKKMLRESLGFEHMEITVLA